ncbi:Short-chain dehydrogenase [Actinokineospora iranica]|uniref:Short-chain dehydrogenase n=1 Tax=Actinokineospora iranica TaxID=1271860 RepID=A0A1G6MAX2_9PSEU|nr:Short-chain dehydrogenase [Actinokineospora iranica]
MAAGHRVVATGRRPDRVEQALGAHDDLLATRLDVTSPSDADAAVAAAVRRFGRVDVLVNNAGNSYPGYFEEIPPEHMRAQIETTLFEPMNFTRAGLPLMRGQRGGHIITISSIDGLAGLEFCAAYATAKFGVEGWMESLRHDVEPFGIRTTVVNPGLFRTEFLAEPSKTWPRPSTDDYAQRPAALLPAWQGKSGAQPGDPAKLAASLVTLADAADPPPRWIVGDDALATAEAKARQLLAQVEASRRSGSGLNHPPFERQEERTAETVTARGRAR